MRSMRNYQEHLCRSGSRIILTVSFVFFVFTLWSQGWSSLSNSETVHLITRNANHLSSSVMRASSANDTAVARLRNNVRLSRIAMTNCTGVALHAQPPMPPASEGGSLIIYALHAGLGLDHVRNAQLFIRLGLQKGDGVAARLLVPAGSLPPNATRASTFGALPDSAQWIELPAGACNASTWGMVGAALGLLDLEPYRHVVVVDSFVSGPFLPSHVRRRLHWVTAFVNELLGSNGVKMAGSMVTCERLPLDGDGSQAWEGRPRLLPHAWAVSTETLRLMAGSGIFECQADPIKTRWASEMAAGRLLLDAGHNIASLLQTQQGVDWRDNQTWNCNNGYPPDRQGMYDGTTVSPFDAIFWPIDAAQADNYIALRSGAKYAAWSLGKAEVAGNRYLGRPEAKPMVLELEWNERGEVAIPLRTLRGGDACFDHAFYARDARLAALRASCFLGQCGFSMFDHYMLVGWFEGREAKWTCPAPSMSREDAQRLEIARGRSCFDHEYYRAQGGAELQGLGGAFELWEHYVRHGQFEGRKARWICSAATIGVAGGHDGTPAAQLRAEQRELFSRVPKPPTHGLAVNATAISL